MARYNSFLWTARGPARRVLETQPMINVAAIRMQQFGVQFYQASLTASDIDKLVRFEVLSYGEGGQAPVRGGGQKPGLPPPSKVHWEFLEPRIAASDTAYPRQIK